MFGELKQLAGLMSQMPRIREEMEKLQQRIGQISGQGDAGGGMVKATANGKLELTALSILDDALKTCDREMLEDLVKSAVNQALERAKRLAAEETGKMGQALGLPGGLNIPGLQLPGT
jgi:DNA-binding YbaB/EbfC family protein